MGSLLEPHQIPVSVGQRIFNANFLIKFISTLNGNLCLFRFTRMDRRNNFFHGSGQSYAWLLGHWMGSSPTKNFSALLCITSDTSPLDDRKPTVHPFPQENSN